MAGKGHALMTWQGAGMRAGSFLNEMICSSTDEERARERGAEHSRRRDGEDDSTASKTDWLGHLTVCFFSSGKLYVAKLEYVSCCCLRWNRHGRAAAASEARGA